MHLHSNGNGKDRLESRNTCEVELVGANKCVVGRRGRPKIFPDFAQRKEIGWINILRREGR
jgi:hypothetical protein